MKQQTPTPKPHFIPNDSDEGINIRIKEFEHDLTSVPEKYLPIISSIGSMALAGAEDSRYEIDGDRASRVREFFMYRYDHSVDFDSATEDALANDENQRRLISELKDMHAIEDIDESGRKRLVRSPEQDKQIETIRHARLAFFVRRLIDWNSENSNDSLLDAS